MAEGGRRRGEELAGRLTKRETVLIPIATDPDPGADPGEEVAEEGEERVVVPVPIPDPGDEDEGEGEREGEDKEVGEEEETWTTFAEGKG